MSLGRRFIVLFLIFSTIVFFMPTMIHADDASPNTSITKHTPEVQTSPEISTSKGIRWWWWALGILLIAGGVAAAAGGGGGDGEQTGSATVTW